MFNIRKIHALNIHLYSVCKINTFICVFEAYSKLTFARIIKKTKTLDA